MLMHVNVNLAVLSSEGKRYKWSRPLPCKCGHIFWGHGFVGRYFDGYLEKIWLKRFRCPSCKAILTMFPHGFIKYFQASLLQIYKTLDHKLSSHQWPPWPSRQRAGHWMHKLKKYCIGHFGLNNKGLNLLVQLESLFKNQVNFLCTINR